MSCSLITNEHFETSLFLFPGRRAEEKPIYDLDHLATFTVGQKQGEWQREALGPISI